MLLKNRSRSKRRPDEFGKFIHNIRMCPCLICGAQAEAAHLRMSSAKYQKLNGRDHRWITPLCPNHHRLGPEAQHNGGEFEFWERYGIDALEIARALWESRNSLEQMQAICETARKNK